MYKRQLLDHPEISVLDAFSQENSVTVVQLIYSGRDYETGSKDYEFSRTTMLDHWAAGLEDAKRSVEDREKILRAKPHGTAVYDNCKPRRRRGPPTGGQT